MKKLFKILVVFALTGTTSVSDRACRYGSDRRWKFDKIYNPAVKYYAIHGKPLKYSKKTSIYCDKFALIIAENISNKFEDKLKNFIKMPDINLVAGTISKINFNFKELSVENGIDYLSLINLFDIQGTRTN